MEDVRNVPAKICRRLRFLQASSALEGFQVSLQSVLFAFNYTCITGDRPEYQCNPSSLICYQLLQYSSAVIFELQTCMPIHFRLNPYDMID